jgi:hypothetical protein
MAEISPIPEFAVVSIRLAADFEYRADAVAQFLGTKTPITQVREDIQAILTGTITEVHEKRRNTFSNPVNYAPWGDGAGIFVVESLSETMEVLQIFAQKVRKRNAAQMPVGHWIFKIGVAFGKLTSIQQSSARISSGVEGEALTEALAAMECCDLGYAYWTERSFTRYLGIGKDTFSLVVGRDGAGVPTILFRCPLPLSDDSPPLLAIQTQSAAQLSNTLEFFQALRDGPSPGWTALFHSARELVICVHGWDGWIQRNLSSLRDFFERGGHLHLILPSIQHLDQIDLIRRRLGRNREQQIVEIEETAAKVGKIWDELPGVVRASAKCVIYRTPVLTWYCAFRFIAIRPESSVLIVSFYHAISTETDDDAPPFYWLPRDKHQRMWDWVSRDLEGLMDGTSGVSLS